MTGSYRESRHGDRGEPPQPDGEPFEPHELSEEAAKLWDVIVPKLFAMGVATALDSYELACLCEHYSDWRRYQQASSEAEQPDARLQRMAARSYGLFASTAKKFGLNPSDRQRLTVSPPASEPDELDDLLA